MNCNCGCNWDFLEDEVLHGFLHERQVSQLARNSDDSS